jgi:hypothetical protein
MGVDYEAEQQALDRRVALKVLSRTSTGDGSAQVRFQREAKAAARMHHTNIVADGVAGGDSGGFVVCRVGAIRSADSSAGVVVLKVTKSQFGGAPRGSLADFSDKLLVSAKHSDAFLGKGISKCADESAV